MSSGASAIYEKPRDASSSWVEEHPVHRRDGEAVENLRQLAEIPVYQPHPRPIGRQALARRPQGGGIPVDTNQRTRRQAAGNLRGVPRAAQRAVEVNAVRLNLQRVDALVQQDRHMVKLFHHSCSSS